MNGYVEMEDLDAVSEMIEDLENDESDESDEDIDMMERTQRNRRFRTPPRTAGGGGLFRPRTPAGPSASVTQTQLQAAMARVGAQIKTNSDALKTVNSRVATLGTDMTKQAAEIKKIATGRSKDTAGLRRDLNSTRQMAAIMPLLSTPKTFTLTSAAGGLAQGTKVVVDSGDNMSMLLPLLMMGGMGGGSGEGGSGGGMGDMMLPMVLLMSQR
jgi:hypothetical protein